MTTYYMRADGSAANKAAATSDAAASTSMNVSVHNAETFSAGDVIIVSDAGGVYRANFVVPSSGSIGSPITYQKNTGGTPILAGSDIITTWTATVESGGAGTELLDDNFSDNDITDWQAVVGNVVAQNERIEVVAESNAADRVRFLYASNTEVWATWDQEVDAMTAAGNTQGGGICKDVGSHHLCYIAYKDNSGTLEWRSRYAEDAAPTSPTNVDSGVAIVIGRTYRIDMHWKAATGVGNNDGIVEIWVDGVQILDISNADTDTLVTTAIQIGQNDNAAFRGTAFYDNVKVGTTGSDPVVPPADTWEATLTTEPNQVILDGTLGTLESAVSALNAANEWFWVSNKLTVYSTSDPDTAFTSPGIEAAVRTTCIQCVDKDYVDFTGLDLRHSNGAFATGSPALELKNELGTGNSTVTNCNFLQNNWCGVFMQGSTGTHSVGNTVDNCTFDNNALDEIAGGSIMCDFSDSNTFSNNVFTNGKEHDIRIRNCDSNICEFNHSTNPGSSGIVCEDTREAGVNPPANNIVRYNFVTGAALIDPLKAGFELVVSGGGNEYYYNVSINSNFQGMRCQSSVSGDKWLNNTIYNSADDGFTMTSGCENTEFRNNIISTSGVRHIDIKTGAATGHTIDNNLYGDDSATKFDWTGSVSNFADWKTNSSQDANSPTPADPLFTDVGSNDFTLQSGSPAIDAGADVSLTQDFIGTAVPQGSAPDIGAYEFGALITFSRNLARPLVRNLARTL